MNFLTWRNMQDKNVRVCISKKLMRETFSDLLSRKIWKILKSWKKCSNKSCECCSKLQLGYRFTFKNGNKIFPLKLCFTYDSSNPLYVINLAICAENYICKTEIGETKLQDCGKDRQHICVSFIKDFNYQRKL